MSGKLKLSVSEILNLRRGTQLQESDVTAAQSKPPSRMPTQIPVSWGFETREKLTNAVGGALGWAPIDPASSFATQALIAAKDTLEASIREGTDRARLDDDLEQLQRIAEQMLKAKGPDNGPEKKAAVKALELIVLTRARVGDQGRPFAHGTGTQPSPDWSAAGPTAVRQLLGADPHTSLADKRLDEKATFVKFKDSTKIGLDDTLRDPKLKHPTNAQIARCLAMLPAELLHEVDAGVVRSKTALDTAAIEPTARSTWEVSANEGTVVFFSRAKQTPDKQLYQETLAAIGEGISKREWGPLLSNPAAWTTTHPSQWTAAALADGFHMYDAAAAAVAQQSPQRDFGQFFAMVQDARARSDDKALQRLGVESPNRMNELAKRTNRLLSFTGVGVSPNFGAQRPHDYTVPGPKALPVASVSATLSEPITNTDGQRVRKLTVDDRVVEICEPTPGQVSEQYAKEVASLIPLLPPLSREALTRVVVSARPHATSIAGTGRTNRVLTVYPNKDGTLPTPQELFSNLLHESGHLVQFAIGNEQQLAWGFRDNLPFDTLWELAVKKDGNHPSRYARTAPPEDFAESYTEYWLARLNPTPSAAKAEQDRFKKEKPARAEILDQLARTSIAKLTQSAAPYKR